MLPVDRVHQPTTEHVCPEAIDDVSVEGIVCPTCCQFGQLARRLIFGTDLTVSAGATSYSSPGRRKGSSTSVPSGTRAPGAARHLHKDRFERQIGAGSFRLHRHLLVSHSTNNLVAWSNKRQQSVVIRLQVVVHERVIMALGALHIAAKNDAADVARHQIWLGPTIERKAGRRPLSRIVAVGLQNFSDQHIPRLIFPHAFQQPGAPFIG